MSNAKILVPLLAVSLAALPAFSILSAPDGQYYGSAKGQAFHYGTCSGGDRIKDENLILFSSREDAVERGYRPCQRCRP